MSVFGNLVSNIKKIKEIDTCEKYKKSGKNERCKEKIYVSDELGRE
jgi:hypothetical protein